MRSGISGAPCPACESIRTACIATGFTDEGYRLRRRKCMDCDGPSFLTAEVHVDATWGELETSYRLKQRDYFRRRQGYQGKTYNARHRSLAALDVKVSVRRRPAA